MESLKTQDRWLAIKYMGLPNCVSPSSYVVFGLNDLDDRWLLDVDYIQNVIKGDGCNG